MSTNLTYGTGSSGNVNVPSRKPTDVEMNFWKYCAEYAAARAGLWIDASSDWLYRNGGQADSPAAYQLIDRIGGRRLTPGITARHPVVVVDDVSDKPCLSFGMGGIAPNELDINFSGDLECASIMAGVTETNRLPLLTWGTGYSIAFAVRIPAPNTTVNGQAYGTYTGGVVLGGGAEYPNVPFFAIEQDTNGRVLIHHNGGGTAESAAPGNLRTGNWAKVVATYDAASGNVRIWIGTPGSNPVLMTGRTDLPVTAAAQLPRIGAVGEAVANIRFVGFLGALAYLPAPVLNDPDARAAAFAWLSERSV